MEGISFVQFDERDVVRHTLVQRIVKAYERYNETVGAGRQLSLKLGDPETPGARHRSAGLSDPCHPDGTTIVFRRRPADVRPQALESFARKLQAQVARGRVFDCVITGDAELRRLNREFRGKDHATDVLSFPAAQAGSRGGPPAHLGDLAISVARAREQARRNGHSTEQEVRILMLHGLLHLMGMDHENDSRLAWPERSGAGGSASGCRTA